MDRTVLHFWLYFNRKPCMNVNTLNVLRVFAVPDETLICPKYFELGSDTNTMCSSVVNLVLQFCFPLYVD